MWTLTVTGFKYLSANNVVACDTAGLSTTHDRQNQHKIQVSHVAFLIITLHIQKTGGANLS